jgi:hypothetical protein
LYCIAGSLAFAVPSPAVRVSPAQLLVLRAGGGGGVGVVANVKSAYEKCSTTTHRTGPEPGPNPSTGGLYRNCNALWLTRSCDLTGTAEITCRDGEK